MCALMEESNYIRKGSTLSFIAVDHSAFLAKMLGGKCGFDKYLGYLMRVVFLPVVSCSSDNSYSLYWEIKSKALLLA